YRKAQGWKKYFGITLEELDQLTEAIGTALEGRVLTREALVREGLRLTGAAAFASSLAQNSGGALLKPAACPGRVWFGANVGQRVQFTRADSWLASAAAAVDPEAATAAVTRRYLAAYGPATYQDLARWWGGGGLTAARQWIAALGDEATPVEVEGTPAWMLA